MHKWLEEPIKEPPNKEVLLVKLLNVNESTIDLLLAELDETMVTATARCQVYLDIEKTYYSSISTSQLPDAKLAVYLTLRRGITSVEAYINWLKEAYGAIAGRKVNQ